ncbi:Methyltransferase type 11 [Bordetella sputigena]|uniref:class I SAM-dependent methyltransferase n=1 Tax=Bordetella sputigena TaxID=1416810 RepID=UPI0039EE92D8
MNVRPYRPVVLSILKERDARSVLDAPCGHGWLGRALQRQGGQERPQIDGVCLYEEPFPDSGYRNFVEHDLNDPLTLPADHYDAVVCGEALHLLTNPGVALDSFRTCLRKGGTLIVTTPNTWHMSSRLQYLLRGFHSGFRPSVGKKPGQYITYIPWSFNQLHVFLSHYGFTDITLHEVNEPKPLHWAERMVAIPARLYGRGKQRRAESVEESRYWRQLASAQSLYGRWLVVSARLP